MVEGKEEQGPFTVAGLEGDSTTLGQLKEQLIRQCQQQSTGIGLDTAAAASCYRWIIGRRLADDDTKPLAHYGLKNQHDANQAGLIYFYILGIYI